MMKKTTLSALLGAGLLGLVGSAHALTFNEAAGISFTKTYELTPGATDTAGFTLSGMASEFSALSFSIAALSAPATPILAQQATFVAGAPGSYTTSFNDIRNHSVSLLGKVPYLLTISGTTLAGTTGATVSLTNINSTVTPVPEPENYAMLIAGLGLVGAIARRRKF